MFFAISGSQEDGEFRHYKSLPDVNVNMFKVGGNNLKKRGDEFMLILLDELVSPSILTTKY